MFKIKRIFRVPIGHRLSKHTGLCKNIHGHNLRIEVELLSFYLDQNDMVMDFSNLKKLVEQIIDKWDHAMFVNSEDITSGNLNGKLLAVRYADPTAEVLSKFIYDELEEFLPIRYDVHSHPIGPIVWQVSIWENDDSCATYCKNTSYTFNDGKHIEILDKK